MTEKVLEAVRIIRSMNKRERRSLVTELSDTDVLEDLYDIAELRRTRKEPRMPYDEAVADLKERPRS